MYHFLSMVVNALHRGFYVCAVVSLVVTGLSHYLSGPTQANDVIANLNEPIMNLLELVTRFCWMVTGAVLFLIIVTSLIKYKAESI